MSRFRETAAVFRLGNNNPEKFIVVLSLALSIISASASAGTAERSTYARLVLAGSDSMKHADYEAARNAFRKALRYVDTDPAAHLGLGLSLFQLGEDKAAEQELLEVVRIDPGEPASYRFLAEIHYRADDLETAVSYLEKAVKLKPRNPDIRARLDRIRREMQTEKNFNRSAATSHFVVKYEGTEKIDAGHIVLRILEDAYSEVGRTLDYYPDTEVQVILYSSKQYREVTDAPGWSIALYDGKIRVPIRGIDRETPGLRKVLFHEYAHVVIRSLAPRCPAWLNEGLAQYFEAREISIRQRNTLKRLAQGGKIPPLSSLEASFDGLSPEPAHLAYLFSRSSVRYLIAKFGIYQVRMILDELRNGSDSREAFDSALLISYDDFEREWKRSLE